ncbi:MAG: DUF4920 domain-containing protein [Flavobacteriaceae bacterium]|jgi:hypothetical protein|nr:DUF4920 domain-containing protein [Flavobacteriaceae bacterium]|tara:strand:+ start:2152 stop:2610 length:459 start_codon:yes stop_codon:yes gene_type:complete
MKLFIKSFSILYFSILSYSQSDNNYKSYGELFESSETINYNLEKDNFLNSSSKLKIEGEILSSCPMKGCWMKISVENDTVLVRFKDYGFFVPKNGIEGKRTIINGNISVDTLSVAQLQHYAEDAGKSKEEIDLITEPEITISFLADGVLIKE